MDSFLTQVSRAIRFPGAAGQACYAPEGPQGALGQAVRASGGQPRAARQCGSFGGSAIQRKQDPFSSLLVAARDLGSRPPIVAEVGGLEPSVPLVACAPRAASGGRKPWAVRPRSHIVRSARPHGERYPRAKPEDDAVGAPRLVFRRWGQDLMRPFRHPTAPKRQAPMGRGCRPRSTSILKF